MVKEIYAQIWVYFRRSNFVLSSYDCGYNEELHTYLVYEGGIEYL